MEHIAIELSPGQRELIDEKLATGEFSGLDDYVAALLRRHTKELAQEKLEALLIGGLESGEGRPWQEYMEELRERIKSRA